MITLNSQHNSIRVLGLFIRKLGIRVTSFSIAQKMLEHPDYPSMLSISDSLTSWNVPNQALKLDRTTCVLEELPLPFIAHLQIDGGKFVLVNEINQNTVKFSDEFAPNGRFPREEFLNHWDGVSLFAEKDEKSGEADYSSALTMGVLNHARLPLLLVVLLTTSVYAISQNAFSFAYLLLLFINFSGILLCVLLLISSISNKNPFIQSLCSIGKKNGCNSILKSDAAKVTHWLNWSEIGLFYFTGSFICLVLNPISMGFLSWLNLLCLPFTFYSIGYQFKTRNWCVLCCCIQLLLWLGISVFIGVNAFSTFYVNLTWTTLIPYIISFLFPVAIWSFLKPFFVSSEKLQGLKDQVRKIKSNSSLFHQLLSSQKQYMLPDDLIHIALGNPSAETVITMVSNPYCGPCSTAHRALDKWLMENEDIQVKVIFATSSQEDDSKTKVAKHATALSQSSDPKLIKAALNDWYMGSAKNYDKWALKYPVNINSEIDNATEKQRKWCDSAEISFTPTIFVNGYKLVEPYQIEDLKYLLS
ncbi:thioredoxin domain-containing protein [Pedobacter panaciterrae]|uniref:thioredoxin domain-containing protein n=1 Tax=Pedobacter panaciterrae TaxID=363849 RepID=UPI00155DC252|nr:thioredoxin domain-containing protein [Pedobacter panaciterrae]NQX56820.1 thioredoxin domain-containing protein [Pedobacter panaciterrae]